MEIKPITKTGLDKIDSSPLDFWWHFMRPDRDGYIKDKQTTFDDALRMAVFEPKLFAQKYVKIPPINNRTNIGKSETITLLATTEKKGQLLLSASEFDTIMKMQDAVLKHVTTKMLCGAGHIGITTEFKEKETGAPIIFRPHWIHNGGIVVSLMSSKDASFKNFQKEAWEFRHDKKAVLQMEGTLMDGMAFVVIEPVAPYKIGIYHLDNRSLVLGRETVIRNCETYLNCMASGIWPGLDERVLSASLPDWAFRNQ